MIRLICQWDVDTKVTEGVTIGSDHTGSSGITGERLGSSELGSLEEWPCRAGTQILGLAGWVVLPDVLYFLRGPVRLVLEGKYSVFHSLPSIWLLCNTWYFIGNQIFSE